MPVPVGVLIERALTNAGIPIDGVLVPDPNTRSTWQALYKASATTQQRVTGDALVTNTAVDAAAQAAYDQADAQNQVDGLSILLKAVILALVDQLNVVRGKLVPPLGVITPAQALAAVRAKAGTL